MSVKKIKQTKSSSRKRDASESLILSSSNPLKKIKAEKKSLKEPKEPKEPKDKKDKKKKISYSLFDEDSPLENINNFQILPVNSEKIYDLNHDLKFQRQLRLIQLSNAHLSNMEHPSFNDEVPEAISTINDYDHFSNSEDDSLNSDLNLNLNLNSDLDLDLDLNLDFDLDFDLNLKFKDRAISPISDIETQSSPYLNEKFTLSIPIIDDVETSSTQINLNNDNKNNNILLSPSSSFNMLNLSDRSNKPIKQLKQSINKSNQSSPTQPQPQSQQNLFVKQPLNIFEYRHNKRNINLALTKDLNCTIDPCKRALNRLAIWSGKAHEMVLNSSLPIDEFII